jgi:hypothetical protein
MSFCYSGSVRWKTDNAYQPSPRGAGDLICVALPFNENPLQNMRKVLRERYVFKIRHTERISKGL